MNFEQHEQEYINNQIEVEQQEQQMQNQQPQLAGVGTPYYQPTIMPSEKADLFDKINPQDIVEVMKYKLMGYEFNRERQEWYKPHWAKGLNERGANEITTLMLPVSSKNVAISKLSDSEIRERTKAIHREAMIMCLRNWKQYGLTGPDQIGLISQIVVSNTFITLKQPENAGIRELIKGTTSEVRSIQEAPEKKGVLGGIFRK